MGVLNVTGNSFSDGGQFLDPEAAVEHAHAMREAGAEIIDVGGESTRPGAESVPEEIEKSRVLPVIDRLVRSGGFLISIDTMKANVARAAMDHGAEIINDVTGLRDPRMRDVVQNTGAGAIAMHMQGSPQTMQIAPQYDDVVTEIRNFFRQTFEACLRCEIEAMRLAFDPGIGFGKTVAHNLALLKHLDGTRVEGRPLVLGVSRKSFIGKTIESPDLHDREWPTVALTSYGRIRGAQIVRVHDVRPNLEALRMTEAILRA